MDHSPFKRLSPELRNEIYDLVSYNERGVFIELQHLGWYSDTWRLKPRTCFPRPLALTEVCKEMRREARGAFLAVNDVSLIVPMLIPKPSLDYPKPTYFAEVLKSWLKRMGPIERGSIKTLELDLGTWHVRARRSCVTETQLAKVLFALGNAFKDVGVDCIVWLVIPQLHYYCECSNKLSAVSFRVTPPDTEKLLSVATKATWHESFTFPIPPAGRAYHAMCQARLLALKTALEKLERRKTAKYISKAGSRIRNEHDAK